MRVRCERLIAEAGAARGREADVVPGDFLRVGDDYLVLAMRVHARPPRGALPADLLILDQWERPIWVTASMFSVTSAEIPSTWRAHISPEGDIDLAPAAWLAPDFWGAYYSEQRSSVVAARETFRRELAALRDDTDEPVK